MKPTLYKQIKPGERFRVMIECTREKLDRMDYARISDARMTFDAALDIERDTIVERVICVRK